MMKRLSILAGAASLSLLFACSISETAKEVSQLKPGQEFNSLTISEVRHSELGFALSFRDTIVLEGVVQNSPHGDYGVTACVFNQKIKVGEHILDLGITNSVYFKNPEEIGQFFPDNMFSETSDGKVLSGQHKIEVKTTNLEINTNTRDLISAEALEVLMLDGKKPLRIQKKMDREELGKQLGEKQAQLWERIEELVKIHPPEDGLFYHNDICDFVYYQTNDEFRSFVDRLMAMGYGIEQGEGKYYLYIDKPVNYQDGELEENAASGLLKMENLKIGQKIDDLTISDYELIPGEQFGMEISEEFQTKGFLYYDEMWYELTFEAEEGQPLSKQLEVSGHTLNMMNYVKFSNKKEIREILGKSKVDRIKSGEKLPVSMVVKNYRIAGAFESEYGTSVEFVSLVE